MQQDTGHQEKQCDLPNKIGEEAEPAAILDTIFDLDNMLAESAAQISKISLTIPWANVQLPLFSA